MIAPDAPRMLVQPHRPKRHDLGFRVGVKLCQFLELPLRDARQLADILAGVGAQECDVFLEAHRLRAAGVGSVFCLLLEWVLAAQAVPNIGIAKTEADVAIDEGPDDPPGLNEMAS